MLVKEQEQSSPKHDCRIMSHRPDRYPSIEKLEKHLAIRERGAQTVPILNAEKTCRARVNAGRGWPALGLS